jgi:multiple sugar transport system substrate-binding protein
MINGSKIRYSFAVALVVLIVAVTAACSSDKSANDSGSSSGQTSTEQGGNADKKVTLKVVAYNWVDAKWKMAMERWKAKNPNIEVELKAFPNDEAEYFKALDVAIAGNEEMDVILIEREKAAQKGAQGVLLELNSLAQKENFDLVENFGPLINTMQVNGKNYYFPYNIDFDVLYYNKDMFDAKGFKYPNENMTFREMVDLAKQLTSGEGTNKVYGLVLGYRSPHTAFMPIESQGWNWVKEDGTPNFTDPRVKEVLALHKELFDSGAAPNFATMEIEKMNNRLIFAQKKAAMIIRNWWTPVQWNMFRYNDKVIWQNGPEFNFDVTFVPRYDADSKPKMQNINGGYGYSVSAKTKHPEEAYRLAKFLSTEIPDIIGVIPAYKKAPSEIYNKIYNEFIDKDNNVIKDIYPQPFVDKHKQIATETIPTIAEIDVPKADGGVKAALQDLFNRLSLEYFSGKTGLDDFINKLQTEAEATVKKLK